MTVLSLIAANYIWQILDGSHNWAVALDRSFFQTMAVFVLWLGERK